MARGPTHLSRYGNRMDRVKHRHWLVLGVGMLLVSGVVGLIWFTAFRSNPASAHLKIQQGCAEQQDISSFDMLGVLTGEGVSQEYDIQVSGDDYRILLTTQDDVMVEFIGLGNTAYAREGNGEWETRRDFGFNDAYYLSDLSAICSHLTEANFLGEEILDSITVNKYVVTRPQSPGGLGLGEDIVDTNLRQTIEYWIDLDGRLVQNQLTWFLPAASHRPQQQTVFFTKISGWGEPNEIVGPESE